MSKEAVSISMAADEVKSWLDYKRIPQNKRDSFQSMIDNLIAAVVDGDLSLDDNFNWKHRLIFPLEGSIESELNYKPRISDVHLSKYEKAVKGTEFSAIMKRTILALTDAPLGVINNLDTSTDKQIAESIAIFFV